MTPRDPYEASVLLRAEMRRFGHHVASTFPLDYLIQAAEQLLPHDKEGRLQRAIDGAKVMLEGERSKPVVKQGRLL